MKSPKQLSHEEFVVAWQGAATLAEAAEKAGVAVRVASMRAANMRKAGVELKRFNANGPRLDVDELNRLAKKAEK